jgi:hypothetical protein
VQRKHQEEAAAAEAQRKQQQDAEAKAAAAAALAEVQRKHQEETSIASHELLREKEALRVAHEASLARLAATSAAMVRSLLSLFILSFIRCACRNSCSQKLSSSGVTRKLSESDRMSLRFQKMLAQFPMLAVRKCKRTLACDSIKVSH